MLEISVVGEVISGLLWLAWMGAVMVWVVLWVVRKLRKKPGLTQESASVQSKPAWRRIGLGNFIWLAMIAAWMSQAMSWVVVAFGVGVWMVVKLDIKQWPAWITASPWRWLWLGLITLILQILMFWGGFGPDTTLGVIPWNLLLLYYGVFFGFGALCYGQKDFE